MTKLSSDINWKLSNVVLEQLERKRIYTLVQFVDEASEKLATFTGLSLKDILEIKRNILQKYGGRVKNACDLLKVEQNNIIPTNLSSLDSLLKGGLHPGQIYEICGISSSGKTQLCLTIAANIALKSNNLVRYIDTKRDFSGSRIEQILLQKNCNKQVIDEAMEHIKVCSIHTLHQLFKVLRWLSVNLKEEKEDCHTRVIIIDSLPAVIFKYSNDSKSTTALNHLANIYQFIANEFHLSIINVNLITQWSTDSEKGSTSTCLNDVVPTLGKYWSHVPNTRLLLEKIGLGNRKLSIWKSFQLKTNLSCTLNITDCGILCS